MMAKIADSTGIKIKSLLTLDTASEGKVNDLAVFKQLASSLDHGVFIGAAGANHIHTIS